MKKFVSLLLCTSLLMSICVSSVTAAEVEDCYTGFNLNQIDPEISLLDALDQYPEIYDIFYIDKVTPDQAEMLQTDGIKTINGDEIPASILYSLNARKVRPENSISPHGSSQNGPQPYEQANGTTPNCYGYALGISQAYDPGSCAGYSLPSAFNVNLISDYVNKDMVAAFNGGARQVSYQKVINSWEWRIATRVGHKLVQGIMVDDFHFWLQTNAGTWCHKPGPLDSEYLGNVRPDTASWDLPIMNPFTGTISYEKGFYDSDTIYMALYRMDQLCNIVDNSTYLDIVLLPYEGYGLLSVWLVCSNSTLTDVAVSFYFFLSFLSNIYCTPTPFPPVSRGISLTFQTKKYTIG